MKKSILIIVAFSFIAMITLGYFFFAEKADTVTENETESATTSSNDSISQTIKIIRDFWVDDKIANTFPKPKKIELEPSTWPDTYPVKDNITNIFFDSGANNTTAVTNTSNYQLSGKVWSQVQAIEVLEWDSAEFLPDFKNSYFRVNLSGYTEWKNTYLIRAYSRNNTIYERIFVLYYHPIKTEAEDFKKVSELPEWETYEEKCWPYYTAGTSEEWNQVWDFMPNQYGENTQKLWLDNGINFLYSQKMENEIMVGQIRFEDTRNDKIYSPYTVTLGCGMFQIHSIKKVSDDEYIFTPSPWHEWISTGYYFNSERQVFLDIYGSLRAIEWNKAYPIFSVDVDRDSIILTESRYCCDEVFSLHGFEKIYLSKDGKFMKREPIASTPVFGKSTKTEKEAYVASRDHGYSLTKYSASTGLSQEYPVTNTKIIDDFLAKHDECFSELGMLCQLETEFEVDEKWNARTLSIKIAQ